MPSSAKGIFSCCVSSLIQVFFPRKHCAIHIVAFKAGIDEQGLHLKILSLTSRACFSEGIHSCLSTRVFSNCQSELNERVS